MTYLVIVTLEMNLLTSDILSVM